MPAGRPTDYTPELALEFCVRLAMAERGIIEVCEADDMPARATVYRWKHQFPEFRDMFARAKDDQMEAMEDGLIPIADDGSNDYMERLNFNGGVKSWELNGEAINRSRLRIDTRKWIMSKTRPRKYGDRTTHEVQGVENAPPVSLEVVFVKPKITD